MRTKAMGYAIKDSFVIIIFGAILFGIYKFIIVSYGGNILNAYRVISLFIIIIMGGNMFSALGASMFGGTYQVNKQKYKYRFSFFDDDKRTSLMMYFWTKIFFMTIGTFVYPIALIYALFNMKKVFSENKDYDKMSDIEIMEMKIKDLEDNKVKGDKKLKVNKNFTNYYFHTYKEASDFIKANKMSSEDIKEVI
jgi:hypothetical protein